MFAYYDSDADIAWFPTGESDESPATESDVRVAS